MRIVILNGSPRKGNTYSAINALRKNIPSTNEVEIIEADKLNIIACKGCDACGKSKGCVLNDDTNKTVDKLVAADMIVFATPVYWWGMTAQIKLVIDKCYSKGALLKDKDIGLIVIGGEKTDDIQYELIKKQFECMAKFLKWNIKFYKKYSAKKTTDLLNNKEAILELEELGKSI